MIVLYFCVKIDLLFESDITFENLITKCIFLQKRFKKLQTENRNTKFKVHNHQKSE